MDQPAIRPFTPADAEWIVRLHAELYAEEAGFDESFGATVEGILADFLDHHDPGTERGFVAEEAGTELGTIFCVREDERTARLRLFLLDPAARGRGLGRRLLQTCLDFARDAGYRAMVLSTHESHEAACALYAANGFRCVRSFAVRHYGVDLVEQHWQIDFAPEGESGGTENP
ncbi:GNAT family N-acetyltransferase [Aquicoccus sp. SCR17]|nr:GNAT family N-acetyltransferase [Carideicomes alvinocaridis]